MQDVFLYYVLSGLVGILSLTSNIGLRVKAQGYVDVENIVCAIINLLD